MLMPRIPNGAVGNSSVSRFLCLALLVVSVLADNDNTSTSSTSTNTTTALTTTQKQILIRPAVADTFCRNDNATQARRQRRESFANENYGHAELLEVADHPGRPDANRRTFALFSLEESTTWGSLIRASIRFMVNHSGSSSGSGSSATVSLCPVEETTWNEHDLMWNNMPRAMFPIGNLTVPPPGQWAEWDITDFIQEQISQQRDAVAFQLRTFATSQNSQSPNDVAPIVFHSRESEHAPELHLTYSYEPPYNLPKFQKLLQNCSLQAPYASPTAVRRGKFQDFAAPYFYVTDHRFMTMEMGSPGSRRSELRHWSEWPVATPVLKQLNATFFIPPPPGTLTKFTFLQIHAADSYSPLLRIAWNRDQDGRHGYLFGFLRKNPYKHRYKTIPLGPRPESGWTNVVLQVKEKKLRIIFNGHIIIAKDVSYWPSQQCYFKAGTYLAGSKGEGLAVIHFDHLEIQV